jgi:pyrimidine operon attenuation protein/uracil phosphoribosyltransferase
MTSTADSQANVTAQRTPKLTLVMDAEEVGKVLRRIAAEIVDRHRCTADLFLLGIPTRGAELARRLALLISELAAPMPACGSIDISMHRDDIATRREIFAVQSTHLPGSIDGRTVILVDDVLYTGRSVRAALDALASYGRPGRIELAVLVDRGHRELPIASDYTGRVIPTRPHEKIRVRLAGLDPEGDSVSLSDYAHVAP